MDMENMMDPKENEGQETEFSVDPSTVRGMNHYQPGDKVSFTMDATVGDTGEDGKVTLTINRLVAEPINPAKKASRDMMGKKPSMAGTAMEDHGGNEGGSGY